jgi:hypothetical protein
MNIRPGATHTLVCLGIILLVASVWPALQGGLPPAFRGSPPAIAGRPSPPPLVFIANAGQFDDRAAYSIRGRDKTIFFGRDGVSIVLSGPISIKPGRWALKLTFDGAVPAADPVGDGLTPAVMSYFKGRPEEWRPAVPTYSRLAYRDLWPGIDLVYSGAADRLKYELIVRPGADPSRARFTYTGATDVSLGKDGRLEITTPLGSFRDDAPDAFQEKDGKRMDVPAAFVVEEGGGEGRSWTYGFDLGEYDPSLPLIIDPAILIYCGFIGGPANDQGTAIARDAAGNVYLTGWTESVAFPVHEGPDLLFNSTLLGPDAFVAKVNAAGTELVYCGFIGGERDDIGTAIAVDPAGCAYVAGVTHSLDFPVTVGPGLSYHGGSSTFSEGFITKVDPTGTSLLYSGFVGGTNDDEVLGVALKTSGETTNAYLTGWTASSDFPHSVGPGLSYNGGRDAFVAKVSVSGAGFDYSGFIGGTGLDQGAAIAVDGTGRAYITGVTESRPSERFPVLIGPGLTQSGGQDAFVARVAPSGSALEYCGYIGGSGEDAGAAIALDARGSAYVAGSTSSRYRFPVAVGPFLFLSGAFDAFAAKVSASGAGLDYCGYIGGSGEDHGTGIAVDTAGNAYVSGYSDSSSGFPVTRGPSGVLAGLIDAFVVTIMPSGEGLYYGGFVGGSDIDLAMGIAADGLGNVWLAGYTRSSDFPVLVGPYLTPGAGYGVSDDAFVAKIFEDLPPLAPENLRASGVTVSSITLAWDDVSGNEDGFEVERKSGLAGTFSRIATVAAGVETYSDGGRPEGTAYFYRVRAFNDIGDSAYSNEAELTTLSAAPTGLSATAVNSRRVDLAWTDHSGGETGFRVERRSDAAPAWAAVGTTGANVTAYIDRTVREETTYDYRVFATNAGGDSAASNTASATTPVLTIPDPPSGLQAVAVSSFSVDLAWTDNSYDEDGFRIERKTGVDGTWAQVGSVGADIVAFQDSGLADDVTYFYRVRAYNNAGESSYSNEAGATTPEYRPRLRVPIAGIAFGNVNICGAAVMMTTLYNDGAAPLRVSAIGRTSGSAQWTYASPAPTFIVPAAGSTAISVRFAPLDTAPYAATFTVVSDDPDNPAAAFGTTGTGFLPSIGITLSAERLTERAWIIRRDYARLEIAVTKAAPFEVATYRLSRQSGGGPYQTIRDFTEADLTAGRLVYNDTFLASGTSYIYKLEALDCQGRLVASSNESGSTAPPPVLKTNAKAPKRRQP